MLNTTLLLAIASDLESYNLKPISHAALGTIAPGLASSEVPLFVLFVCLFLLDIFFIYISNAIPFPSFLSENTLSPPPLPALQPTHSCFLALVSPCIGAYNLCKTKLPKVI